MRKFKFKGQKGLSLVEVTIMLLVLMLLTSVLAPSIFDFVIDARWVKVKEDCEAIGISVARLTRDVGPCLMIVAVAGCTEENRADILFSDGPGVTIADEAGLALVAFGSANVENGSINWDNDDLVGDAMEDQFVTNAPAYSTPLINYPTSYPVGPLFGLGWRGAYLAPPIGPDPWGHRYLVNSVFLAVASNSTPAGFEGSIDRWWERDVFCISAGPNGLFETPIAVVNTTAGTTRAGDDFIYVVQGSGR